MLRPIRAALAVGLLLGIDVACTPTPPEPVAPGPPRVRPAVAPEPDPPPPAAKRPTGPVLIVRAEDDAGRLVASPRRLRNLIAEEHGRVGLVADRQVVSLYLEAVLEGAELLADPDLAKRPIGANRLEVLLVDDAAFAAALHPNRNGFGGTWRLTRRDDGTLVARAIEDTPFAASAADPRSQEISRIRGLLREPDPRSRLEGIAALGKHPEYELVPDVIALLDDDRFDPTAPPRRHAYRVREEALQRLRQMLGPLADVERPQFGGRSEWETYWTLVTTRPPRARAPIVAGATSELMRVAANQTFPELVGLGGARVAIAVTRLEKPSDGARDGIALVTIGSEERAQWVEGTVDAGFAPQRLAATASGKALLFTTGTEWRLALTDRPSATPIVLALPEKTASAAIAEDARGFGVVSAVANTSDLVLTRLDLRGRPVATSRIPLPVNVAAPSAGWIDTLAIASRNGAGWLIAAETSEGISLVGVDRAGRPSGTSRAGAAFDIGEAVLGVRGDRVMVAALTDGEPEQVVTHLLAAPGLAPLASTTVGDDVGQASPLAVLDDGFALAWIEADEEVHLGRWDLEGELVGDVVVHRGEVRPFHIALHRDGGALVVAYEDTARYPYALVARRIAIDDLR